MCIRDRQSDKGEWYWGGTFCIPHEVVPTENGELNVKLPCEYAVSYTHLDVYKRQGQDILTKVDSDINAGKIELFTDQKLKDLAVYKMFENNVRENRILYLSLIHI